MPPFAFLASSWSSEKLKQARLKVSEDFKHDSRGRIWVAEAEAPQLKPELVKDQLEIVDVCLDAIAESERFILVDNGSYGTPISEGQSLTDTSFLELELFQALLLSKPVYHLFVGLNAENSELFQLLTKIMPEGFLSQSFDSLDVAFQRLPEMLEQKPAGQRRFMSRAPINILTGHFATSRTSFKTLYTEPEFLQGLRCGPISGNGDLDAAAHYLTLAMAQSQTNRILSRTWIALRALMGAHYADTTDPKALNLWQQALFQWSRATAWRGLHAHLWLGNVAALGSILRIKTAHETRPSSLTSEAQNTNLFGAFASAYYSISKRVPLNMREKLLSRSEAYISAGLTVLGPEDAADLLPIRGSLHFRRRQFRAAAQDYQTALDRAQKQDPLSANTGFLLTELGFAEIFLFKPWAGRQKIEDGLKLMSKGSASPGFIARALRKHALVSAITLSPKRAQHSARKANLLAEKEELYDQIKPINRLIAAGKPREDEKG